MSSFCMRMTIALVIIFSFSSGASGESLADYQRLLDSVSGSLEHALERERARPGSGGKILDDAARSIPTSVSVELSDSTKIDTDLSSIKRDIRNVQALSSDAGRAESIEKILLTVQALSASIESMPENQDESLLYANSVLADILRQNEYRESFLDSIAQRVWAFVMSVLEKVLGDTTLDVVGWVVIVLAVVACAIALAFLVMRVVDHLSRGKSPFQDKVERQQVTGSRPTVESLIESAEQSAAHGEYRDAFRNIYVAAILVLDRGQVLSFTKSGTNWEYLRAVKRQGALEVASLFSDMTSDFDEYIYGQRSVSVDDYSVHLRRFRELEGLV